MGVVYTGINSSFAKVLMLLYIGIILYEDWEGR